jgi:hypothetical protein
VLGRRDPIDPSGARRTMIAMTIPIVTELPPALQPLTADPFAVVVPRDSVVAADAPPARRRIVD